MRIYLDHAATSPMPASVLADYASELRRGGNPAALHATGQSARLRLEDARERIAACLGAATPAEVVLTSGGTEADNLALKGLWWARRPGANLLLISEIEHPAVLETAEWLAAHEGAEIVPLAVDERGRVDPARVSAELERHGERIALISVMLANNEIGTIQPVAEIARIAAEHGVPVHTDAVQAPGQIPVDFRTLGVAAMSVSGHKVGAPVGIGALLLSRASTPVPVLHGGGQERGVRSGTVDVAGATAFATALELATGELGARAARMAQLRDRLIDGVEALDAGIRLTGARGADRLPGNVHLTAEGCEGETILFLLDAAGFDTGTGSACHAGVARPSHVLMALGRSEDEARSAQRFTLGPETTEAEIDALLSALPGVIDQARAAGMVSAVPAWQAAPIPGGAA